MITVEEAALIGYEAERQKIVAKILELELQLKGRAVNPVADAPTKRGRKRMSAAARKRIAAAQKKRWAEYHKKAEGRLVAASSRAGAKPFRSWARKSRQRN
jgi:hypothetical protein